MFTLQNRFATRRLKILTTFGKSLREILGGALARIQPNLLRVQFDDRILQTSVYIMLYSLHF